MYLHTVPSKIPLFVPAWPRLAQCRLQLILSKFRAAITRPASGRRRFSFRVFAGFSTFLGYIPETSNNIF